jgi:hypothetical protein
MKYICLVYLVENDMNAMPKKEADACVEESPYDDADQGASPVRRMR